jgi:molecular chaperone GrpE
VTSDGSHEPVTITDKRRIDPQTGAVREAAPGPAPSGPAPGPGEQPALDLGAGAPAMVSAENADLVEELTADLKRVQADFVNYRKRALRDQQLTAERAKAAIVVQLLPVLDDLDRARRHGDLESGPLKSVADKLAVALESLGLSGFGEEGDRFDPSLHEAVQHEGDGSNPVVGSVLRRGYRVGDQVVRHALVGVVDAVEAAEPPPSAAAEGDTPDICGGSPEQAAESESSTS